MPFSDALGDRRFVSQYGIESVGLEVRRQGVLADADANLVTARMTSLDDATVVFDRQALHVALGQYETLLSSAETATPGIWKVTWSYALDAIPQTFVGLLEVGESAPAYDALDVGFKAIIESVWIRFADLFDSPEGGPHLQVYFQSRFGRGRMAQLLKIALQRLNTVAQPHQTYGLDATQPFPYAQWGGLLDTALYIETIKHLIRSYVEQPEAVGVNIARQDRRDYMNRWESVLRMEESDFKSQMDVFKMAHMGLGRPSVLIAGGAYGNYGAERMVGSAVARPRYWHAR